MPKTHQKKLFFADVLPLVPLWSGRATFYSYLSETDIPEGSLVLIPFGRRRIRGVVLRCKPLVRRPPHPAGRFKHIESIIASSFLTPRQLRLAEHIAETSFTSLGKTLIHFLPSPIKERKKQRMREPSETIAPLSKNEAAILKKLTSSRKKNFLLENETASAIRLAVSWQRSHTGRQTLILLPELLAIPDTEEFFVARFGNTRIAVLHSRLSKGRFFSSWERIRSGEAEIVVGTRQSLFAPFRDLSAIFIINEEEIVGYKQWDMSPRYDGRTVAETLAELHKAKLILTTPAPSLETIYRIAQKEIVPLTNSSPFKTRKRQTIIVDMRKERWKKNYSLFSEELTTDIRWMRKKSRQTVLVVSRSGLDSFSVCAECKTVPKCPLCGRALQTTSDERFKCPSCSFRTENFPHCEKCGSLSFRNIGAGTEKIEREAKRRFPEASILRLDEETLSGPGFVKYVKETATSDILIGTPSILNLPFLPRAALVAIIDADNFLSLPDFRSDERLLGILRKSEAIVSRFPFGKLLIQTFAPEKGIVAGFPQADYKTLADGLLEDRKTLSYPPLWSIWKLTFRNTSEQKVKEEAKRIQALLKRTAMNDGTTKISPVIVPLVSRIRGKHTRFITVRIPRGNSLPDPLHTTMAGLPGSVAIEPDPLSLT